MRPTGAQVRELADQGLSDRMIGRRLKCALSTVQTIRKENGISPGVWGRKAQQGSRRYQERYGSTYNPEPALVAADEGAWKAALAGGLYENDPTAPASEGPLRLPPPEVWSTGECSMAWAG